MLNPGKGYDIGERKNTIMKKEMSSVDVAAIIPELGPRLRDAKIGKIYQTKEDEIRITLHKEGRQNLVIEAGKRFHLTRYPRKSPPYPQPFPMLLRKHLTGGRIKNISQYDFDRVIQLHIERGGVGTLLIAELFARGNIILLNSEGRIILPLKSISYRERKIMGGELYELPSPQISPVDARDEELKTMFLQSDSDIVRTLATRLNMGGQYAEETCLRANLDKNTPARELTDIAKIRETLSEVFRPITSGELKPHIVLKNGESIDVLPLELTQYQDYEKRYYPSFNEALDEYFSEKIEREFKEEKVEIKTEKIGPLEYRLAKQRQALEKFGEEERAYIRKGEIIYSEYEKIKEILGAVKKAREKGYSWGEINSTIKRSEIPMAKIIEGIDKAGIIHVLLGGEDIELKSSLEVLQNAQVYYEKAKKIAAKKGGASKAIEQTLELMKKEEKEEKEVRLPGKIPKEKRRWYEEYRWFVSSDGFLVLGGRDAQSNEDLVKKHMEKRDIFFHTQRSGSPAVIVKTEGKEVPQTTFEEAAQFVVSYSSIWKDGQASGDCYWVLPDQVSKTPEHGEYVPKGAFIIRGKRNYFKDIGVGAALGVEMEERPRLIGGPPNAIKKRAKIVVEVEPGEFNQNDLSKKIYRLLLEKIEDKRLVKTIASPDKIAMYLPPGGSRNKKL